MCHISPQLFQILFFFFTQYCIFQKFRTVLKLNDRERHIVNLRFYEGKTQMEVAQEIGISQAQVSRLEKNALRVMRNYLR